MAAANRSAAPAVARHGIVATAASGLLQSLDRKDALQSYNEALRLRDEIGKN
jgi:hypothetical protein